MPTAIARISTPEGFVIAADCLAVDKVKGGAASESAQKIFPVCGARIAYSLAGTTVITRGETQEVLFDFVTETKKALKLLPNALGNMADYAQEVGIAIYQAFSAKVSKPLEQGSTTISLDGYYGGTTPEQHEICFRYPSHCCTTSSGRWIGSPTVLRVLWDSEDPRLAAYKITASGFRTLSGAIAVAKRYILAYSDPEAYEIDAKICASVGKRIHMATLTLAEGFRWVPGFEPPSGFSMNETRM